jgi:hypothetical protein
VLKKADAFAVMAATRLGYEILTDSTGEFWYRKHKSKCIGPFSSIQSAVQGAIDEYDNLRMQEFLQNARLDERDV